MSYRNTIREAVKARLSGQLGIPDEKIFTKIDRPLKAEELPAVLIYTSSAKRVGNDNGRGFVPRSVTVTIEVAKSSTPDDALDDAETMAETIEAVIEADLSLGNAVHDTVWRTSESDVTSMGKTTLGVCMLEYDVTIMTNVRAPGSYDYEDDGFTEPPSSVESNPKPIPPDIIGILNPPVDSICGVDGCDVPAWNEEYELPIAYEDGTNMALENGQNLIAENG